MECLERTWTFEVCVEAFSCPECGEAVLVIAPQPRQARRALSTFCHLDTKYSPTDEQGDARANKVEKVQRMLSAAIQDNANLAVRNEVTAEHRFYNAYDERNSIDLLAQYRQNLGRAFTITWVSGESICSRTKGFFWCNMALRLPGITVYHLS